MYSIKKRYKTGFRAWVIFWLTQIVKAIFAAVVIIGWTLAIVAILFILDQHGII